jgi:hypothetical protein
LHKNKLSVAIITWARDAEEETLLRSALSRLALMQMPVFVTDGGSGESFIEFLYSLPNFTVVQPLGKGLWNQVNSSLNATLSNSTTHVLYTEPDKLDFLTNRLENFVEEADEAMGIVLASRTEEAFASYPVFQQTTETSINFCCAEVIQQPFDFTYGPFILNSKLIPFFKDLPADIDWGWRPFAFCIARRLGYAIQEIKRDNYCPFDQRQDSPKERIYRMKQLHQNIEGVVLSTLVEVQ